MNIRILTQNNKEVSLSYGMKNEIKQQRALNQVKTKKTILTASQKKLIYLDVPSQTLPTFLIVVFKKKYCARTN